MIREHSFDGRLKNNAAVQTDSPEVHPVHLPFNLFLTLKLPFIHKQIPISDQLLWEDEPWHNSPFLIAA